MFLMQELEHGLTVLSFTPAFAPGRSGAGASALLPSPCGSHYGFGSAPRTCAGRVFVNSSG
jgi:hypothetical protein